MQNIFYIGFGDLMQSIESKLSINPAAVFKEILQLNTDNYQKVLSDADVFLIGPYTLDPVRQIQRANQQNPLLSILVLIFPEQFQKVKQQVQFSLNIGRHVTFISYQLGNEITTVLDAAVTRTIQRRSFSKINQTQTYATNQNREITFHNLGVFLENAPIGAIVFDNEKSVVNANYKAKELFNFLSGTLYKMNWSDLFPEQDLIQMLEARRSDTLAPIAEIIKVNNRYLEINVSVLNLEKLLPHYLLLLNDVTDKIKVENQLKNKIEELEFLNHELDEFVNVVSHDFKTPLTSISLLAEMALKENSPEKQLHFIKQIKRSSDKLKELFKGLGMLIDTKKNRSEKVEDIDFQQRLAIILTEYEDKVREIGADIKVDFKQAPRIAYFKAHIDSILSNMITNALKYRRLDEPLQIEIKSRRDKEYIILSINDNGIGIDLTKNMNKLFQPFKRLTDQDTGSGLGLSIIKRMIEKDQGYLEVFSRPGQGTEFKAYLKEQS